MGETCHTWNTRNLSNNPEAWLYNDFDRINILVLTPCIIIIGILSNLAFLYTIARLKRMQTVTNYYLAALAICDIIVLASGPPLLIFSYGKTPGPAFQSLTTSTQCICVFAITALGYYASLAVISLVSSERYFAMCSPLRHRAISGKARTFKMLLGALVFGITFSAINVPSFAVSSTFCVIWPAEERFEDEETTGHRCGPISFEYYIYQELFTILIFIIALIYNSVLYIGIVMALSNRSVVTDSHGASQTSQVRNQVARLLILNGVVFFVCQAPYRIVTVNRISIALFNLSFLPIDVKETLEIIGTIMIYVNSAINPTLYALGSRFYRVGIMEALGLARCVISGDKKSGNSTAVSAVSSAVVVSDAVL